MHPDWLGNPQHFVAGGLLAGVVVLLAPRFSIQSAWVAAALAVGIVMVGEALVELAEYPLRYSDDPNLTAYFDTLADLASSLVGGVIGAGAALTYRLRSWARHSPVIDTVYLHVTSSANRCSIEKHGLDWTRMGDQPGVAGDLGGPEVNGIWLADEWWEVEYFGAMAIDVGIEAVDVWEVRLSQGAERTQDEAGYLYWPEPIPRTQIKLVKEDWTPPSLEELRR